MLQNRLLLLLPLVPVDGAWGAWREWSFNCHWEGEEIDGFGNAIQYGRCSGTVSRRRLCDSPAPAEGEIFMSRLCSQWAPIIGSFRA